MKSKATKKALNSKYITGIHVALLLDGWNPSETFSGLKYSPDSKVCEYPKGVIVHIIFGDYDNKKQYETDAFVEIQYEGETVIIWNVAKFEYFKVKQALIEYKWQ